MQTSIYSSRSRRGIRVSAMQIVRSLPLLLLLLSIPSAKADAVFPLPIKALTAKADLVVRGKILSTTVQRDSENRIYTSADLLVQEVWKGALSTNHFTLVHSGGALGDEITEVSDETEFAVGEEVVAFVVLNKRGEGVCIGMSQGKFKISDETGTGEKLVHNRFHGLKPTLPDTGTNTVNRFAIRNRVTLAGLKTEVTGGAK